MTKQSIREAAAGRWVEILTRLGIDGRLLQNTHGPCPGCGGRDRFRFDDLGRNGTFICSQGGGELLVGDGFRLLEHSLGWDWRRAIGEVARILGLSDADFRGFDSQRRDAAYAAEPVAPKARLELDRGKVEELVRGVPAVSFDYLRRRSAIDPVGLSSGAFLDALYEPGERVLVFVSQMSQGDFLWVRDKRDEDDLPAAGGWRLSQKRGVKATRSELPTGTPTGVWFLTQPVSGTWAINQKRGLAQEQAKYTRRSECNVTAWRYFVLESDELAGELWLRVLVNLPLPIAAIYTSGRRSFHALVRFPVGSKAEWDAARNVIRESTAPVGADPAALTAVRLSRLPGCLRGNEEQRLLYLNPDPEPAPIRLRLEVRE